MSDRLDEIRARLAAATPRPWVVYHKCIGLGPGDDESAGLGWDFEHGQGPPEPVLRGLFERWADANLISSAPDDLAYLLGELEEARANLGEMAAQLDASEARAERLEREIRLRENQG